ncbi:MAG: type II secretion system minor pseudopilin GspJ [Burkholderiales bacterium]|nr:type II secretion system minor pseudopilin GspJ [Burkholderiales bacterium]
MKKHNRGFTLIEVMIAIMIFAIISVISYRIISALLITKQVVTNAQNKWGNLAHSINRISTAMNSAIPLVVRDTDGMVIPAVLGKNKLQQQFDSQLELTMSGKIGDPVYGTSPPRRVGFRFIKGTLYEVSWPVLNRVITTNPRVDVLLNNVALFTVNFLYPDKEWRDTWPLDNTNITQLPTGIKIDIQMNSGEKIMRQWNV